MGATSESFLQFIRFFLRKTFKAQLERHYRWSLFYFQIKISLINNKVNTRIK